jgi:hypothetical protein
MIESSMLVKFLNYIRISKMLDKRRQILKLLFILKGISHSRNSIEDLGNELKKSLLRQLPYVVLAEFLSATSRMIRIDVSVIVLKGFMPITTVWSRFYKHRLLLFLTLGLDKRKLILT